MSDRFEDERGVIQDLLDEPIDAVTEIFTVKGAVRGNHTHAETTQWVYCIDGLMRVVERVPGNEVQAKVIGPGDLICERPGIPHAWRALEDTTVLVFTRGPRSGANYEDDVQRLTGDERLMIP